MSKSRRHFSDEFKANVVRRHLEDKVPVSDLAAELEVQPSLIHLWIKQVLDQAEKAFQRPKGAKKKSVAAVAVEDRDQEVESASQIEIADIDMPVPMRCIRLYESRSLLAGCPAVTIESTSGLEHAIRGRGTHGDDIVIQHHEGQPTVALQRMKVVERENGLAFPGFKVQEFQIKT